MKLTLFENVVITLVWVGIIIAAGASLLDLWANNPEVIMFWGVVLAVYGIIRLIGVIKSSNFF